MIVDTMTIEEVGNAVIRAYHANEQKLLNSIAPFERRYKRIILKNDTRFDFVPVSFLADGIRFYVCPYSRSKSEYKKYGLMFGVFAHFFYQGTNWYVMLCGARFDRLQMYKQHFFERYIQRHLKDDSSVTIDTVRHYFKESDYITRCQHIEHTRYENCVYGANDAGVCCGYYVNDKITVWSTYLDDTTVEFGNKREVLDNHLNALPPIGINWAGQRIFIH
jgi:hypothetical protein